MTGEILIIPLTLTGTYASYRKNNITVRGNVSFLNFRLVIND